jgi:hypothetical protein
MKASIREANTERFTNGAGERERKDSFVFMIGLPRRAVGESSPRTSINNTVPQDGNKR